MTLVTLSGIDGSGKTMIARRVAELLSAQGIAARSVAPEYRCNDVVKAFCADRFGDPYAYVPRLDPTLYISVLLADWLDFARQWLARERVEVLVSDRYVPDVLAQAIHYGADLNVVLRTVAFFAVPSLCVHLRIRPSVAYERLQLRASPAAHHLESEEHLQILASAYERVWDLIGWECLEMNAELAAEEVARRIVRVIAQRFPGAGP